MSTFLQVDIERLPKPHGDCVDNIDRNHTRSLYEDLYPVKYSVAVSVSVLDNIAVMCTLKKVIILQYFIWIFAHHKTIKTYLAPAFKIMLDQIGLIRYLPFWVCVFSSSHYLQ